MDQRIALTNLILVALGKINTSIQKTKTYKDGNIYSLDSDGMVELSGASALIAFLGVTTVVPGVTDGTSAVSGILNVETELRGISAIVASSGEVADLDVLTELGSSIAEISGAGGTLGDLDIGTLLRGVIAGQSDASVVRLNTELLAGKSEGGSGIEAVLDSQPGLAAVCISATSAIDENDELYL